MVGVMVRSDVAVSCSAVVVWICAAWEQAAKNRSMYVVIIKNRFKLTRLNYHQENANALWQWCESRIDQPFSRPVKILVIRLVGISIINFQTISIP